MLDIQVERLTFRFPDGWNAARYDAWSYYRNQFVKMRDGIKAVDLIAVETGKVAWFIEAKDYRTTERTKPSDLADEVAMKVFDTLAAMVPASVQANEADEQAVAAEVCRVRRLRVVLHLEQPAKHTTLRPRAIDPAAVKSKLRTLVKPIDPHAEVVGSHRMGTLAWSVT